MHTRTWEVIGTTFEVTVWDDISKAKAATLFDDLVALSVRFDALYSRFKADSLITKLSQGTGVFVVPSDLVAMLRLYEQLYIATAGKLNPAIGFALSDTGYDARYSLTSKSIVRPVPALPDVLTIIDDVSIELKAPVLFDLGALGKGYVIDMLYSHLQNAQCERFLINGSGDIRYYSLHHVPIVCGLEDPHDATKAIGTLSMTGGALCASATNRRRWGTYHHYLDPHTLTSPAYVAASWVYALEAAIADGLSSALFFIQPEAITGFTFSYMLMNEARQIKKSADFAADLFR